MPDSKPTLFHSINPATEESLGSYTADSPERIDLALREATLAQANWKQASLADRSELILKLGEQLRKNLAESAQLITREMGKPIAQARAEVEKCASLCDYYCTRAEEFLGTRDVSGNKAKKSYVRFDPQGVVLAVMPWNFPFWQVLRFAVPAALAGNACVLKHATNVLGCAREIEQIFHTAGFPAGLFRSVIMGHDHLPELIRDPRVRAVTLTGSERAGRAVGEIAGKQLKPCVLELGGSDPFIVCDDADLELAATRGKQSRTLNNGQSCIAAKRFLVHEKVHEPFVELFVAKMRELTVGDPEEESIQIGPLARKDLRETLHRQVQSSLSQGAKAACGGELPKQRGWYYPPTVLTDVVPGMAAFEEETFGPVAAVIKVKSLDEAVELANASQYGLGANVFTGDIARGEQVAARIESGAVFINDFTKSDPTLPFGGVKDSGYGRELGEFGIHEFVNVKTVWVG